MSLVTAIKSYQAFQNIEWGKLHTEKGPFIPAPSDECDTGYFKDRAGVKTAEIMHSVT